MCRWVTVTGPHELNWSALCESQGFIGGCRFQRSELVLGSRGLSVVGADGVELFGAARSLGRRKRAGPSSLPRVVILLKHGTNAAHLHSRVCGD
jgi:hypothetical protein